MDILKLPVPWQEYILALESTVRQLDAVNAVLVGVIVLAACFIAAKNVAMIVRKKSGADRLVSVSESVIVQRMLVQFAWQGVRPVENLNLGFVVIDNVVAVSSEEHHAFGGSVVMEPVTRGQILHDVIEGRGAAYRINANRTVDILTLEEIRQWRNGLPESTCTHGPRGRRASR